MNRRHALILLSIFFLALILRVIALATREIWYDDAFSIFLSQQPLADIVKGTAADTMPPLYYFILHYWMDVFGGGLASLRLLSILFSLLTWLVFFDLCRRAFGINAGLWAAFLVTISPIQVFYAQEIRMYTLLEFTQALYFWCFFNLYDIPNTNRKRRGLWAGLILAGVASMYTHNLAIFGLVVADIYLVIQKRWRDLLHLIAAQAAIIVMALPWLVMVPGQIEKIQRAFSIPRPGIIEIIQAVIQLSAHLPLKGFWMIAASVLAVETLVVILIETVRSWRESPQIRLIALVFVMLPGILFAISYFMRPIFITRGFLISALAYCGLAGWIIARRSRRGIGIVLAVTLIAAAAISLPSIYTFMEFPRSAYRETATYLRGIETDHALILHDNKLSFFPTHYYAPELPQEFLADEPGSHNDTYAYASQQAIGLIPKADIKTAADGYDLVYFVVFQRAIEEYREMGKATHPVLAWLESEYKLTGVNSFADLEIYVFER